MFEALKRFFPQKRQEFEAKLRGIDGFTGRGEVEYTEGENGERVLEVELKGVAGRTAEVYIDRALTVTVPISSGRADETFMTRRGDTVPQLFNGQHVEIRQNGQAILAGVFAPD